MWKVTPAKLERLLEMDLKGNLNPIIFIWGQPGIGKTQIVQQVCSRLSYRLLVLEVSTLHPYALSGIPVPHVRQKKVELLPLSFISDIEREHSKVVLFLDDFGAADPQQQRIALSITTYRQIGDFKLPPNCRIVVATNREEDAAYVITPSYAVLNRSKHYRLVPSFDDWVNWLRRVHGDKEPLLSLVVRFLLLNQHHFCWQPELAIKKRAVAYPTPRSWTNFILDAYQVSDLDELALLCASWVGDEGASDFYQFCLVSDAELSSVINKPVSISRYDKVKQFLVLRRLVSDIRKGGGDDDRLIEVLEEATQHVDDDVVGSLIPEISGSLKLELVRARLSGRLLKGDSSTATT